MTRDGAGGDAVARLGVQAAALALLASGHVEVVVTAGGECADPAVAQRGVGTTGVTLLGGRHVGVAIAATGWSAADGAGGTTVAASRVHRARIAFLGGIRIHHAVAANPAHLAAVLVAGAGRRPVVTAHVALLSGVDDRVPAHLSRLAVVAALIEDKRGGVVRIGSAILDVAVVAYLTGLDNAVSASSDINTHSLIGGADLAGCTLQGKGATSIWQ
jgi:hypothetical protein